MVKTSVPKMKEEEIKIRRLMQKCEDWLSNKISNVTDDKKWWRLDQVFIEATKLLCSQQFCLLIKLYSILLHWMVELNNLKNQIGKI